MCGLATNDNKLQEQSTTWYQYRNSTSLTCKLQANRSASIPHKLRFSAPSSNQCIPSISQTHATAGRCPRERRHFSSHTAKHGKQKKADGAWALSNEHSLLHRYGLSRIHCEFWAADFQSTKEYALSGQSKPININYGSIISNRGTYGFQWAHSDSQLGLVLVHHCSSWCTTSVGTDLRSIGRCNCGKLPPSWLNVSTPSTV